MGRSISLVIAAGLAATAAAAQVSAQTPSQGVPGNGTTSGTQVVPPTGQVLNEDEIRQKLREEGYQEVTELRLQGPSYEAKAVKDGRSVNLTVDARTGSVRSTY